ncbi:MAG TPA: hypothetical protein ENI87_04920 [bacterium]|nr:hypothetical protein [bacterium]
MSRTEDDRERVRPAEDGDPERIGPYRILSRLGEGGMGVVYLAERREPMRMRVALKVMKRGLDSDAFLARFEAERQALALMEHSNIAKVYDAGVTPTGQPFLAMEHVKGVPITTYCDDAKLTIPERVELFVAVCSAMQHAHNKGVMHRDLKPSNILVSVQDGKPVPKIIDFGLAKAVDHRLVEATVFTEQGQVIGTPEYMSPEQAGVGGLDVDARTDVFSLGVLLYQLLTGTLPVTREELLRQGWFEMQRLIREGELPKPSTKVTTLGDGAEAYAKARRMPLGELRRCLRGELDWIVMKAIEKERSRRYTTVHELASDLLRHLHDEPVSAGPPSATYVLRKTLRKYRGLVTAVGAAFVALVAGLVVAAWQWRVAEGERLRADQRTREAEDLKAELARLVDKFSTTGTYPRLVVTMRRLLREAEQLPPEGSAAVGRFEAWIGAVQEWRRELGGARLPELLAKVRETGERREGVWLFPTVEQQLAHDALVDLVEGADRLVGDGGWLPIVRASLAWSRRVKRETVDDRMFEWGGAAAAIASNPAYGGLQIRPQEGLVPLGVDPESGLYEFWFVESGERPEPLADQEGHPLHGLNPEHGIVFVLLPGGEFTIGTMTGDRNAGPERRVTLAPFFLSKYELTQAQWQRWTGWNRSRYKSGNHPAYAMQWYEADRVLRRKGLSLPTEAQWEYACRAGTKTRWYWGDAKADLFRDGRGLINIATGKVPDALLLWDVDDRGTLYDDGGSVHMRVGFYPPNGFGLHEMHGNIAEFVRGVPVDHYQGAVFASGDGCIIDGVNTDPEGSRRVQRGGSWYKHVGDAESAARVFVGADDRLDSTGIRPARALVR